MSREPLALLLLVIAGFLTGQSWSAFRAGTARYQQPAVVFRFDELEQQINSLEQALQRVCPL